MTQQRNAVTAAQTALTQLSDEVELLKSQCAHSAADLTQLRSANAAAEAEVDTKMRQVAAAQAGAWGPLLPAPPPSVAPPHTPRCSRRVDALDYRSAHLPYHCAPLLPLLSATQGMPALPFGALHATQCAPLLPLGALHAIQSTPALPLRALHAST